MIIILFTIHFIIYLNLKNHKFIENYYYIIIIKFINLYIFFLFFIIYIFNYIIFCYFLSFYLYLFHFYNSNYYNIFINLNYNKLIKKVFYFHHIQF